MGMDQYLLIPFLGGWTSIYQLFLCSPGVQGFDTLPYDHKKKRMFFIVISASEGSGKRLQTENQKGGAIKVSSLLRWEMIKPNTAWLVCLVCLMMNCESHVFLRTIFYKLCMEHMYIYNTVFMSSQYEFVSRIWVEHVGLDPVQWVQSGSV
jgi:hypothetical protein